MALRAMYPVHSTKTASRIYDGEAVVVQPLENSIAFLSPVASRIWELADGSRSVGDIVDALCTEYEVERATAEADVAEFLAELGKKDIIILLEAPRDGG